jgi:6-phosphofructokinase 1
MVCEVMGRNAGWIALHSGVASGSDVILIPEIPFNLDAICEYVEGRMHRKRGFSIIACSEGARLQGGKQIVERVDPRSPDPIRLGGVGKWVAEQIADRTNIETRTTVLGHVQRGGNPMAADRVLATQFGYQAVHLLTSGSSNRMVVVNDGRLGDVPIEQAVNKQRLVPPDDALVAAARAVKTCFGD